MILHTFLNLWHSFSNFRMFFISWHIPTVKLVLYHINFQKKHNITSLAFSLF